jgi:hypothetical protein
MLPVARRYFASVSSLDAGLVAVVSQLLVFPQLLRLLICAENSQQH